MTQLGDRHGLATEALAELRVLGQDVRQHLQGDHPLQRGLVGLENGCHAAPADLLDDLVRADLDAWRQLHSEEGYRRQTGGRGENELPWARRSAGGGRLAPSDPDPHRTPTQMRPTISRSATTRRPRTRSTLTTRSRTRLRASSPASAISWAGRMTIGTSPILSRCARRR